MNHTLLPALAGGQFQAQQLPVAIDYPAALALRHMGRAGQRPAEVPAGTGGQRPALLHARPAAQDAVHHAVEHRRAHQRSAGADAGGLSAASAVPVRATGHAQAAGG